MIDRILNIIADADGVISGDAIGLQVGISRVAVNKYVKALILRGINIKSTAKGYKYIVSDTLDELTLARELRAIKRVIIPIVKVTKSTNTYAKELVTAYGSGDYLVAAPYQTAGKGRLNRNFLSEVGGVYMTYTRTFNDLTINDSLNIVLLTGLAVSKALSNYGVKPTIKWPNDVFVNDKKICGILLESSCNETYIDRIYLGIGVNVNNPIDNSINNIATSLGAEVGRIINREEVIVKIIKELDNYIAEYLKNGQESFATEYCAISRTIGREVTLKNGEVTICGRAVGLSKLGYLLIERDGARSEVIFGDIM